MDENRFWSLIESAWQGALGNIEVRQHLAKGEVSQSGVETLSDNMLEEVIPALEDDLDELSQEELLAFDRILEQKLYDIDRADIHEHTDGSDDGFLYARGFIVAVGKAYYDAVNANPAMATMNLECEDMRHLSWHLYREKFGEMPKSGISESNSNKAGWAEGT